jgi:Tfp pilus assembly protein PilV
MKGFTFIEILISFMLVSLLLVSIDATQLTSLREAESAYNFSVAANQIQNFKSQLSNNPEILAAWNLQNSQVLPNGQGTYFNNKITVYWGEHKTLTCDKIQLGQSGCVFENIAALPSSSY